MDINTILNSNVLESLMTGLFTFLIFLFKEKWKKSPPGLTETADRIKKIDAILAEIQFELNAYRTQEWIVTNGDKTLSGHSIQKLSMFCEFNKPGVENIASTFQFVPASNLSRNIIALAEAQDGYIISNEDEKDDDLATLHVSYGIKTALIVKIVNMSGQWVGILFIGFDEKRMLEDSEIAFTKLKASQMGAVLK